MRNAHSTHDTGDMDKLLEEAHMRKVEEHIPLLVFMSIMAIVGVIGNILTIIFYGFKTKKTSTIALITLLAIWDLIVCCLCFTTIADLFVNIMFTDEIICKCMYFVDHWFILSSVITLWIISIDRYRKMCKPLGKQFSVKSATCTVIVMSMFSMIFSTHVFLTYKPVEMKISTSDETIPIITGHYCTNTDDPDLQTVVIVFHVLDILTTMTCLMTFIYTYGSIWRALRKHNLNTIHIHSSSANTRRDHLEQQSATDYSSKLHSSDVSLDNDVGTENFQEHVQADIPNQSVHFSLGSGLNNATCSLNNSTSIHSLASVKRTGLMKNNQMNATSSKTSKTERNLTIMMSAITVGFIICFTPYFAVTVGIRVSSVTMESELNTGTEFALRSPFWNSVINPIIFCVFNPQYRQYLRDVFTHCRVNMNVVNGRSSST